MDDRILVISEYAKPQDAGTGALVYDAISALNDKGCSRINVLQGFGRYRPGGLGPVRLFNFVYLHLAAPVTIFVLWLYSKLARQDLRILVLSSPPLIQFPVLIMKSLLKVPVIFWCLDAHPEMEARSLDKLGLKKSSKLFRWLDRCLTPMSDKIIVLDQAMRLSLESRIQQTDKIEVVSPWITIAQAECPVRGFDSDRIRILYAGNYGMAHDLRPLFSFFRKLPANVLAKVEFTFVGLNPKAQQRIERETQQLSCRLTFTDRAVDVTELEYLMESHSLGLVSLGFEFGGMCCPSKSFTYLAYGLPLLYVGPPRTLAEQLCIEGWGLTLEEFEVVLSTGLVPDMKIGECFPQPSTSSKLKLKQLILSNKRLPDHRLHKLSPSE